MRDHSSVLFTLKFYALLAEELHQSEVSRLATAHIKIHQIPHVIFETFFKLYITLQCDET